MHSYHLQAKGFEVSACIVMEVDLVAHSQAVDDLPDSDPSSFSPKFNWPNGDLGVAGETKRKSNHSPHCLTDRFLHVAARWMMVAVQIFETDCISTYIMWIYMMHCMLCPTFPCTEWTQWTEFTIRRALKWPEPTRGAQQVEALRHLLA